MQLLQSTYHNLGPASSRDSRNRPTHRNHHPRSRLALIRYVFSVAVYPPNIRLERCEAISHGGYSFLSNLFYGNGLEDGEGGDCEACWLTYIYCVRCSLSFKLHLDSIATSILPSVFHLTELRQSVPIHSIKQS